MSEAVKIVLKTGAEISQQLVNIIMSHLRALSADPDSKEFGAYFALVTNCRVSGFGYEPEAKQMLVDLQLLHPDGTPQSPVREVVLSAVEGPFMYLGSPLK